VDGIVVGVDRSPGGRAALRWAVRAGERRGLPVTAMHAWGYVVDGGSGIGWLGNQMSMYETRAEAEALVAELVTDTAATDTAATGVAATGLAVQGSPAATLARAAEGADSLVVGGRGSGGFSGLLLGSVADQVVRHASGVVTVVRRRGSLTDEITHEMADEAVGTVVAAVDGSPASRAALARAAIEARARGAHLRVLYVRLPVRIDPGPEVSPLYDSPLTQLKRTARHLLTEEIRLVLGNAHGLDLEAAVLVGEPAVELLAAAAHAALLVVGSRGRGGFAGLLLGSVSNQCVHHAACPVTVVRAA
jgi:nucleotide-binding universal stress UspA family protein